MLIKNQLMQGLTTSYVNHKNVSDQNYHTKLLINDYKRGTKVLRTIQQELLKCKSFMFSVAFITEHGLTVLANELKEVSDKGIRGKILTSTYLFFNHPKMFRRLLSLPNIEVRVYDNEPLHAKGYIFQKDDETTFIVGSSNLTADALAKNKEWNIRLTSLNQGQIIKESISEFNNIWNDSEVLTEDWIENYSEIYNKNQLPKVDDNNFKQVLVPNKMQVKALRNLERLREEGKEKALLISSTGTGKTYLSAFDVKNANPNRVLFVIHREQIAREAMRSFKKVMPDRSMGIYSSKEKSFDKDFIFTTVQTMSRDHHLGSFRPDDFDYIIIDEAHRSGAETYQKILSYFKPKFLLGMTATPERTDDISIYESFDYNIAYEIRLQAAMEEDMLCPFNYFGVNDITVDGKSIDDSSSFSDLTDIARVRHIAEMVEYYGFSGNRVKGLIFCSNNNEADEISRLMNSLDYKTIALSGANTQEEREFAIRQLSGEERLLDYIVTVDIFNEGIDIPELNQVVMLRPTQSAIIFVQQLGRGLRKHRGKEFVNIIDFIGNYKRNFLIPIALSGDTSYNSDTIKQFLIEGNSNLPGVSTINFDSISRQRIYDAVNSTNFSTFVLMREEYYQLKNKIGKIPSLNDYVVNEAADPSLIFAMSKNKVNVHGTYQEFIQRVEDDYTFDVSDQEMYFISLVTHEFTSGKRDTELIILEHLIYNREVSFDLVKDRVSSKDDYESVIRQFNLTFFTEVERAKYGDNPFIYTVNDITYLRDDLILSEATVIALEDLIDYGFFKFERDFSERSKRSGMVLNQRYTRKEMCKLFNWDLNQQSVVYGYKDVNNTFPIFITYHKDLEHDDTINYDDKFLGMDTLSWMSRNSTTTESKDMQRLINYKENNIQISLFVKKEDTKDTRFFYLGEMIPLSFEDTFQKDKNKSKIVNVIFKLENSVREDIFHFLTES